MSTQTPIVRVGVAAAVRDAHGKMVMGIRKGSHGLGESLTRSISLPPPATELIQDTGNSPAGISTLARPLSPALSARRWKRLASSSAPRGLSL